MPYSQELVALRRVGRFRQRRLFDPSLIDFASNDYLGLAEKKSQLHRTLRRLENFPAHAPKASLLVNGYHPIHEIFERRIAELNGFEAGIVVGSGFLANFALIESLVRKKDTLFIDEEYHASGRMASKLLEGRVEYFPHNNPEALRHLLRQSRAKRKIVAVEGVYSMGGDLLNREIFDVVEEEGAILVVDEAHSSGVLGDRLLGIFEHYGLVPGPLQIKMGTLGKAYGSYGAYILASRLIVKYLENRGKPIIYSTAPSVIDTALALENIEYVRIHATKLRHRLEKRRRIVKRSCGIEMPAQILPYPVASDEEALRLQRKLLEHGFLVGAIRRPTVQRPILRIIPRLGASKKALRSLCSMLKEGM